MYNCVLRVVHIAIAALTATAAKTIRPAKHFVSISAFFPLCGIYRISSCGLVKPGQIADQKSFSSERFI